MDSRPLNTALTSLLDARAKGETIFARRAFPHVWQRLYGSARLRASLLCGQVADYGELEHLSLIGLEHQNQPDYEAG